jgi:REP element-mobilizing transposase RayT
MSELYQSLSHSKWDCKYHVVFIPKRDGSCCSVRRDANWEKSSTRWRDRKNVKFSKGICCRITCICA